MRSVLKRATLLARAAPGAADVTPEFAALSCLRALPRQPVRTLRLSQDPAFKSGRIYTGPKSPIERLPRGDSDRGELPDIASAMPAHQQVQSHCESSSQWSATNPFTRTEPRDLVTGQHHHSLPVLWIQDTLASGFAHDTGELPSCWPICREYYRSLRSRILQPRGA